MRSYYYPLSFLPSLSASGAYFMSRDEFLESIKPFLTKSEYRVIDDYLKGLIPTFGLLKTFALFEKKLNMTFGYLRAEKLNFKLDSNEELPQDDDLLFFCKKVLDIKNPLEAEKVVMDKKLRVLKKLSGSSPFSFSSLCAYCVKLKLLYRFNCFTKELGESEFKKLSLVLNCIEG